MKHILVLLLLTICFTTIGTSSAAEFIPLGSLSATDPYSIARGVSDDGSVVVGKSRGNEYFIWTKETGMVGIVEDVSGSPGHRISGDGTTAVGGAVFESLRSFVITESAGLQELSFQPRAVSFDGSVIVGTDFSDSARAIRWTSDSGVTFLGSLGVQTDGNDDSQSRDVSSDGSVVVGDSTTPHSNRSKEAFRWTFETGMVGLGDLPGGEHISSAYAVTSDGTIVVGQSDTDTGMQAFRWSEETGMIGLPRQDDLIISSGARGVSADGNTIVGQGRRAVFEELAFIWTPEDGTRNLQQVLSDDYGLADN